MTFDKDIYGLKHEVGLTITDWNLNIDPTDEDSWTFGTSPSNATVYYQLFDENGARDAEATNGDTPGDYVYQYTTADVGDIAPAGVFTIDRNGETVTADETTDAVVSFQDNADTICVAESGNCSLTDVNAATQPVTFVENGSNTGVFINWDEALKTNIIINEDAKRGTQAVFNYDGIEYGVLHQPQFGTIAFDEDGVGGEWNSGEVV